MIEDNDEEDEDEGPAPSSGKFRVCTLIILLAAPCHVHVLNKLHRECYIDPSWGT